MRMKQGKPAPAHDSRIVPDYDLSCCPMALEPLDILVGRPIDGLLHGLWILLGTPIQGLPRGMEKKWVHLLGLLHGLWILVGTHQYPQPV